MTDKCIVCNEGELVESDDKKRVTCSECSTTWVKKGHEKKLEDKI